MSVLILKSEADSFESCISRAIHEEGYRSCNPFKIERIRRHPFIFSLSSRFSLWPVYEWFLGDWMKEIERYDTVIAFDNGLKPGLLKWIGARNPQARKIAWLWNAYDFHHLSHNLNYLKAMEDADDIFCFDEDYAKANGLRFAHQFHFPRLFSQTDSGEAIPIKYDVSFLGSDKDRIQRLTDIARELERQGISYRFQLVEPHPSDDLLKNNSICVSQSFIPYEEVLELVKESRAILDLPKPGQNGLTLRSLEALFAKRKLITTNKALEGTPLDNEDTFIVGVDDWADLKSFLNRPNGLHTEALIESYSFSDWLQSVLDHV